MYKTRRIGEEMDGQISVIDDCTKDNEAGVFGPSYSFYHDPLQR